MLPFNRIIAIVLILLVITALTLVMLLGTGTEQIVSFAEARAVCGSAGQLACNSAGDLPFAWITNAMNVNGTLMSCGEVMGCRTCESCGFLQV